MRGGASIVAALAILAVALAVAGWAPGAIEWAGRTPMRHLPYALLALAFGLGLAFRQSRVSHVAALMAATFFLASWSAFAARPDPLAAAAAVLLGGIAAPALATAFCRAGERGMLTPHGNTRSLAVAAAALGIFLLARLDGLGRLASPGGSPLLGPIAPAFPVSWACVTAAAVCAPLLFFCRKGENAQLGRLLLVALLAHLAALAACRAAPGARDASAFLGSLAAALLLWALLEAAWRHATIDELTDLPGRHAMHHHLRCLGPDYCLAVLDIDHFKKINDRYGHDVGDQVLRFVAAHMRKASPWPAYRSGGEEFVIVAEQADVDAFEEDMEGVRRAISATPFHLRGADRPARKPKSPRQSDTPWKLKTVKITASIGLARSGGRFVEPADVLRAADQALYRAKEAGRNKVCRTR